MILNIKVTKEGAKYPVVTVNGYTVDRYGKISQVRELINDLFDIDTRDVNSVFLHARGTLRVQDTQVDVDFTCRFEFTPESTGEEITNEIVRRLTIIKNAVETARSVSYTYNKTVILV